MTPRHIIMLAATLALATPQASHARIGERRTDIERRLMEKKTAITYGNDRVEGKLTDKTVPYRHLALAEVFPPECQHAFYFKKVLDEKVTPQDIEKLPADKAHQRETYPDGWDIHVMFLKDASVMECYRLNHERLNEFQINGLLELNKGASKWREVLDTDTAEPSVFGYDYVTEDGKLRAKLYGNMLIIYNAELDRTMMKTVEGKVAEQLAGF
ncbi:MAG TPA: hypothetical protein PLU30_24700 [Verrucomicrobiae bacterium]|nr:hypothetical protein [Verrucomicrobiae bacterium]